MTPLTDALTHWAHERGDAVALIGRSGSISYFDLWHASLGLADRLATMGIGPGHRVAVCAPNTPGFVAALFGVMFSGGSVVCLSPDATVSELEQMLSLVQPDASVSSLPSEKEDALDLPDPVFRVDESGLPKWEPPDEFPSLPECQPDDEGFVGFTSGSTGAPKAVVHRAITTSHASQLFVRDVLGSAAQTLVSTLPLYHLGGLTLTLGPAILTGGSVVLMRRFHTSELLDIIERHRVATVVAIPAMMELLLLRESIKDRDLSSLERVVLGGAPVSTSLVSRIKELLKVEVQVGYGQTECPGFWSITKPFSASDRVGPFVGRPSSGYHVEIQDDRGGSLSAGELGEICIKSRFALLGYVEGKQLLSAFDERGWFHSGDLGALRDDGGLELGGRKKDMYIRGGYNVYPREVEDILAAHPQISQAVVHAIPDVVLGERGCAWLVPRGDAQIDQDEIIAYLQNILSSYKLPDVIYVTSSLPMNDVGKVDKKELARRHRDGGVVALSRGPR